MVVVNSFCSNGALDPALGRVIHRYSHRDDATLSDPALYFYRTPVLIHNPSSNRQPQSGASHVPGTHLICPPKAIEDVRLIGIRDPDSGIGYVNYGVSIRDVEAKMDPSTLMCVFYGVVDQYKKQSAQGFAIPEDNRV